MLKKVKTHKGLKQQVVQHQRHSPGLVETSVPDLILLNQADTGIDEEYIGHLAAIVESSDDAIISKSLDGMIRTWNKGSEKMFGYIAEEAIGKHISLIIPPEYSAEEKEIVARIRNNETIGHYETVRNRKNGEHLFVSLMVSPLKDRTGAIVGISKIIRDITSRKKSEADLFLANEKLVFQSREKENRAAELVVANKELAFQNEEKEMRAAELLIANEELVFQNEEKEKRAAELTVANEELAFQNAEKEKRAAELFIANKELAFQNEEKEKRAAELLIANKELVFQNEEKERRSAELTIANEELVFQNKEKENRATELSNANYEVIERTRQLESANKELDSFSYSVSHDLRAPLRAVNGYARMLEEDYGPSFDSEGKRLLGEVQKNASRMGTLIDDLLAFSKLGKKEIKKSVVDMKVVTDQALQDIGQTIHHHANIRLGHLFPVMADRALMEHVMTNLLSNAIKYSSKKEKAVIEIESILKNEEIIFSVKDNGVGFDMKYVDKLFGVFQRLHSSEEFPGTGVGLAIVHRIIQKHEGKIWAEGKTGEGATFFFSLPNNPQNLT